ncbi:uncharacterized protein LOC128220091 [Mya arenaria]|uniref:uncharacterized protein LOC128220091 n=1 Tax=Mya arenaria TaxID=6604 RepID=UPI0022E8F230|nr:uncharacterized protein LOC128220091 [Mya arenaria]
MDKRVCGPCLFDNTKKAVDGFCVHCVEYLCNACCHEHRKNTVTRGHKLLRDENTPQDDSVYQEIKRLRKCKTHPEKDVVFECSDHAQLICVTCFTHSHKKCEHIVDISSIDTTVVDATAKDLQTDLQQLEKRNTSATHVTDRKLSSLQQQKATIKKACSEFSEKVKNHIDSLEGDVYVEIERTIGQDISILQNDEISVKEIEKEISFTSDMMKAVHGYKSNLIQSIVRKTSEKKYRHIEKRLKDIQTRPFHEFSFEPENELTHFRSLGKIVSNETESDNMEKLSEEVMDAPTKTATGSTPEDNITKSKLSSEQVSVSSKSIETNTKRRKDAVKSFLEMKVSKTPQNINVKFSNDMDTCSIVACDVLPESVGSLIVLDSRNCKLKVLSGDFTLRHEANLPDQPLDMCLTNQIHACTAYICFSRIKTICFYRISQQGITDLRCFPTSNYAISITSSETMMFILSSVRNLFEETSARRVIEIRKTDGSQVSVLKSKVDFDKCTRIRMLDDNHLVCIDDTMINCYTLNTSKTEIMQRKWYYKHSKKINMKNASDVNFDDAENMYVCLKESQTVSQVNALDLWDSRTLCNVSNPLSIAMDSKSRRLFVGCMNDDSMYTYHFS